MKNFEQMAADVLRRRDEAVAAQAEKRRTTRRVATVAAACLLTVGMTAGIGGGLIPLLSDGAPVTTQIESDTKPTPEIPTEAPPVGAFWEDTRERNDLSYTLGATEGAIEWSWEDRTDFERYTQMEYEGKTYLIHSVVTNYLGEWLASGEAYGYEFIPGTPRHSIPCEIYALTFSPDHSVLAVQFEGSSEIYRFERKKTFDPPLTLGEFMETRKLSEVLPLTVLYYNNGTSHTKQSLSSEDSDAVWAILAKYGDASFVKDYTYYHNREDVGFSATSEVLGIRNLSFKINEEGYIVTNIEQYGYYYHIGVDAAREVIDYIKAHMTDPLPEEKPTVYQIVGTITEIGDGYIKVDDSVMMKNPEEGLVFTIDTTDKRLNRVVKLLVGVGDHVLISYDGRISNTSAEDPLLIENATRIQEVWIDGRGDVWIPE